MPAGMTARQISLQSSSFSLFNRAVINAIVSLNIAAGNRRVILK